MDHDERHRISEQKSPDDVHSTAEGTVSTEDDSLAPTFVKPSDVKDESDRPVVNPVTGGAL